MIQVKFFGSEVLENGTKIFRLEVFGSTVDRPYGTSDCRWQQVTIEVTPSGTINADPGLSYTKDFFVFPDWPSRKIATWEEILKGLEDPKRDPSARWFGGPQVGSPSNRWLAYDTPHQQLLWERWFDKPLKGGETRPTGFRLWRKWFTNHEVEGDHGVEFVLEYCKNTPKKQGWIKPTFAWDNFEDAVAGCITMQTLHACPAGSAARALLIEELKSLAPDWAESKYADRLDPNWGHDKQVNSERYPVQDHSSPGDILEYYELSPENRQCFGPEDCD